MSDAIVTATLPRMLKMARGRPLETAVVKALAEAAQVATDMPQRIDAGTIGWEEATTRLVEVHEARSAAVMTLPRNHPWLPMLMGFIKNRGEALSHLLRDRGYPEKANTVVDGDRRMMAVLGMLR